MIRAVLIATASLLLLAFSSASAAVEPLVGIWQLDHQEMNGQKKETEALTLRISAEGDKFLFAFSVPVNNIDFVSLSYAAKLDGTESDVKNAHGDKVGTVQLTTTGRSHYKLVLKGENHPDTIVQLSISADGKTLTSESSHLVQTFSRH